MAVAEEIKKTPNQTSVKESDKSSAKSETIGQAMESGLSYEEALFGD